MSTTAIRVNGKATGTVTVTEVQVLPPQHWVDDNPSLRKITDDIAGAMEAPPRQGLVDLFLHSVCRPAQSGRMVYLPVLRKGIGGLGTEQQRLAGPLILLISFWVGHWTRGHAHLAILLLFPPAMA